jgi:4-aminobutyrate aminotransferase-like enzyme
MVAQIRTGLVQWKTWRVAPPAVVTPEQVATALDIYDQALTAVEL